MTDSLGRVPLDATLIAARLYPHLDPPTTGRNLIEEHLLKLDEDDFLTLTQGDHSWWIVLHRTRPPALSTPSPAGQRSPLAPESSTAIEREGEREERARERARVRARARAQEVEDEQDAAWATWRRGQLASRDPAQVPLEMLAPPIGCHEHPHGALFACGPCGTAREYRRLWFAKQSYEQQLADEEFWSERAGDDDEPF